mgnify:CR=1 FL=1
MEAVNAAGYHAEPHDASQLTKAPQESAEEVNKRHRIVSSVILLIPLMIVAMLPMMPFAPDALLHSTLWPVASPLIQLVLALVILIINRATSQADSAPGPAPAEYGQPRRCWRRDLAGLQPLHQRHDLYGRCFGND